MNKDQIKDVILKTAGYPESGAIAELADAMATAIVEIDTPEIKKFEPVKETRVIESKETR
jgi:TRAP-type uncharacterized transport system substrate-binding protein